MNETKLPGAWKLVPVPPTAEMVVAIEAKIDEQLTASGIAPRYMFRQDGDAIYAAAMAAAPVAVPGMPSAARDAALEEVVQLLSDKYSWAPASTPMIDDIRALKSIAGPVASAAGSGSLSEDQTMALYHATEPKNRDPLSGVSREWINAFARAVEAATRPAPAPVQQAAPSAPTDISAQLREYAGNPGYSHNDYADTMRQAADEIERYYGGMLAWKKSAKESDARAAAPAQPVGLSDERISQIAMEIGMGTTSYELDPGAYCRRFARAILAAKEAP